MKRAVLIVAALMAAIGLGSTEARADFRLNGFSISFGSSAPRPYVPAHSHSHGYSHGPSHGHHGGRGSYHYDYHPTQVQFHRGHVDVVPGHYDLHRTRHGHR